MAEIGRQFKYPTGEIVEDFIQKSGRAEEPQMPLEEYLARYRRKGITAGEDVLSELVRTETLGSIFTLAAFIRQKHPIIETIPENNLRMLLFMAANGYLSGIQIDLAASELDLIHYENALESKPYMVRDKSLLQEFQQKLLERKS